MDGYSFYADDDEAMMPAGRVERRGGDHLADAVADLLKLGKPHPSPTQGFPDYDDDGTFLTMKDGD